MMRSKVNNHILGIYVLDILSNDQFPGAGLISMGTDGQLKASTDTFVAIPLQQHVQTTEASVVEEPNTPKVPPTEELNAATQLVTKHSKAQSNSGPRRPRKPPTWMNDYVV